MALYRVSGVVALFVLLFGLVVFWLDIFSAAQNDSSGAKIERTKSSPPVSSSDNLKLGGAKLGRIKHGASVHHIDKAVHKVHKRQRKRVVHVDLGIDIVNSTKDADFDYWPEISPDLYENLSRAFEPWSSEYSWCETRDDFYDQATPAGLLFVKLPKAASSTLSGIVLRIAHGQYGGETNVLCKTEQSHVFSRKYRNRNPAKSFLLGNVRDVVSREISHLSYHFGTENQNATTLLQYALLKALSTGPHLEWFRRDPSDLGFQLGYLSMTSIDDDFASSINNSILAKYQPMIPITTTMSMLQSRVERVIQEYDFITVTERMDESLVALQFLLDLDPHDLLYLPSKVSGGYSARGGHCVAVKKLDVSSKVDSYLRSERWYRRNFGDYLLYKAVNASLDKTIQRIGQERFDIALQQYRQLLRKAHAQCSDKAVFPCSKNGTLRQRNETNCYERDWGCGYPCLDQVK